MMAPVINSFLKLRRIAFYSQVTLDVTDHVRSNVTVERKGWKIEEIAPKGHFLGEKRAWGNTQSTASVENKIKFHRKCRMRILFQDPSPVCQMQAWLDFQSTDRDIRFLQLCWISFYSTVTLDVTTTC